MNFTIISPFPPYRGGISKETEILHKGFLESNHKIKKQAEAIIKPVEYVRWNNVSELVWQIIIFRKFRHWVMQYAS